MKQVDLERVADCGGDDHRCKPRNYHADVVAETDDKRHMEIRCDNCGAVGQIVVSTGMLGGILAVEGDFDIED